MCIFNPGSTLPSISIAPPSFFDVSFSNVQLFISPDITSLSPIAPPVSPAFKFLKEEPSIDIFPWAYIAAQYFAFESLNLELWTSNELFA